MNRVVLMGRLTKDIELRYTQSNMSVTSFTIATDRYASKEKGKVANFINCKAFGKTAENIGKFFQKGSQILIEGEIVAGSYEKDGRKVYTTDVFVSNFYFVDGSKKETGTNEPVKTEPEFKVIDESNDDLPF